MNTSFEDAKRQVQASLPKGEISSDQARKIIQKYTAAIEGNFVGWMGAAAISARSVEGRYAASENLWVEMKDNHASMLRSFATSANAEPDQESFAQVAREVESIRGMVSEMSGLKNLVLMAVLENTSAEFIPLLEKLAIACGSTNILYTKVHGEADILHANQFLWAVEHEKLHYENPEVIIEEAINTTVRFLLHLFQTEV